MIRLTAVHHGSPPQVWGNRRQVRRLQAVLRFTPTGVGKSHAVGIVCHDVSVHPHRCGEISFILMTCSSVPGSPPQVWGNLIPRRIYMHDIRFTPTGVGKSREGAPHWTKPVVHPHRCGEIRGRLLRNFLFFGSPPQVWGNLSRLITYWCMEGFTPTGVGKSLDVAIRI